MLHKVNFSSHIPILYSKISQVSCLNKKQTLNSISLSLISINIASQYRVSRLCRDFQNRPAEGSSVDEAAERFSVSFWNGRFALRILRELRLPTVLFSHVKSFAYANNGSNRAPPLRLINGISFYLSRSLAFFLSIARSNKILSN